MSTLRFSHTDVPPADLRARLEARLRAFRGLIESASVGELLDGLLGRGTKCRGLIGPRARLDHFGLLLTPGAEPAFRAAAARAGFERATPGFASCHVARELGLLAGGPGVPTTVVKQTGTIAGHGTVAVEGFVPRVDRARAEAWVARDVASHLAVEVADATEFARVVEGFPAHGLGMPVFMDGPSHVPAERATIAYFELGPDAALPRLEVRVRDRRPA